MNEEKLEKIKENCHIVMFARDYTEIREVKQGPANNVNFVGKCPFPGHKETTGSFHINLARREYKCHGCGRSGDVIKLVSEMTNSSFSQTVAILLAKAQSNETDNLAMYNGEVPENWFELYMGRTTDEVYLDQCKRRAHQLISNGDFDGAITQIVAEIAKLPEYAQTASVSDMASGRVPRTHEDATDFVNAIG